MPRNATLVAALVAAASLCCVVAWPGRAADPLAYTVSIAPTHVQALDAAISGSSQLLALRKKAPAGPFALVARARSDIGRIQAALRSFGYYQARHPHRRPRAG
jgi:hypothetical protein